MKKILLSSIFALIFLWSGQTAHAATTVTCYNTCSPSFSSYVGTVILDLQCNASSPLTYTGSLRVNGVSLSYSKTCIPPTCSGATPANATLCAGDGANLSVSTSRAVVSACTPARKCEYTCLPEYVKSGNTCILRTCAGSVPANGTQCAGDSTGITSYTAWQPVLGCTARKCEYTLPPLTVFLSNSSPVQVGSVVRVTANPEHGLAPYGPYTWTGTTFDTPKVTNVNYVDLRLGEVGLIEVEVDVKDSLNQRASDSTTILVEEYRTPQ